VGCANRLEVRDLGAHALYIAELQRFRSRTTPARHVRPPSVVTVNVPKRPDAQTPAVHRTDRNQPVRSALTCGVRVG